MGGKYKDVGEKYAYQIPLEYDGLKLYSPFTYDNYPGDFEFPPTNNGWIMRKAIKKWALEHPAILGGCEYRIVRANGYWRDLHGNYVYELWIKENSQVGSRR